MFWLSFSVYATEELVFKSGEKQNTLVELYTSEGCSSCPPAEKYLNNLVNDSELWKSRFPVAFHVNYWDYIGWKDPYARAEFGQRQSRYANLQKVSTVYTPAFMVNGKSWRPGIFSAALPNSQSRVGELVANIKNDIIKANFTSTSNDTDSVKLNVAIIAMDLVSHIERGENEGRTAEHEFVVIGYSSSSLAEKKNSSFNWKMQLPKKHFLKANKHGVVVWVSKQNDPTPIQVVGGLLR